MNLTGTVLFLVAGFIALLSAIGTIAVRSPIRAAMCLFVHILALSGLFLTLHAHLLAALQVLVYAGAVVVLFVFVIMLIGPGRPDTATSRGLVTRTMAAAIMGVLTLAFSSALTVVALPAPAIAPCAAGEGAECLQFGGVGGLSHELFKQGAVPFELISVLLTVAIVGAIAVARGRTARERDADKRRVEVARGASQSAAAQPAAAQQAAPAQHAAAEAVGGE